MPAMVRSNKKAEKIAHKILGIPVNLQEKPTRDKKKIEDKIQGEIISRDR
jgi:hypothetical protein